MGLRSILSKLSRGRGGSVDARTADELLRARDAVLVDVREPSEWSAGHVAGAIHIPLGRLDGRLHTLPKNRRIVVTCRSGHRSRAATKLLRTQGFDAVNLSGGMTAWHRAGLPLQGKGGRRGRVG